MKVRYVGDDPDGVELACSGQSFGVVLPDQVAEVPDDVYAAHQWPESVWAVVSAKKTVKESD